MAIEITARQSSFDGSSDHSNLLMQLELPQVSISRRCADILNLAAKAAQLQRVRPDVLSSTTFCLVAYKASSVAQSSPEPELERTREIFERIEREQPGALSAIVSQFFYEAPDAVLQSSAEPFEGRLQVGPGLKRAIALSGTSEPLETSDLINTILADRSTDFSTRLLAHSANVSGHTVEAPAEPDSSPKGASLGRNAHIYRESTEDELALGVNDYAMALATVFRAATGEFNFALFGPWGIGKTTLTKRLTPLLEDPKLFIEKSGVSPNAAFAKRRFVTVVHNAWKYKTPPEAWIYLYKSLAEKAVGSSGILERRLLALRMSITLRGYWPLVTVLALMALSAAPKDAIVKLGTIVASFVGLSAFLHFAAAAIGSRAKIKELFAKHLKMGGQKELGMLALVGDDLRALIASWTKPDTKDGDNLTWSILLPPLMAIFSISALWGVSLSLIQSGAKPTSWLSAFLDMVRELSGTHATPFHVEWTDWLIWSAWSAFSLLIIIAPKFEWNRPDRVLLIIDDLDRCDPLEMLSVIENVRLLLDQSYIRERLHVLMLVDERFLEHAISERYKTMIEDHAANAAGESGLGALDSAKAAIVAEQIEKLFACHLRMSALKDRDVEQLVEALAGSELRKEQRAAQLKRQSELETQLMAAKRKEAQARTAYERARELYSAIRDGAPNPTQDENAPSEKRTLPTQSLVRLGIDSVPPTEAEVAERRRRNAKIRIDNERRARLSPAERLAEMSHINDDLTSTEQEWRRFQDELLKLQASDEPAPTKPQPLFTEADARFTQAEINELRTFAPDYFKRISRRPSPRSIRALLFKVQLARLLLQLRFAGQWKDQNSLAGLIDAFSSVSENPIEQDEPVASVIRQVI